MDAAISEPVARPTTAHPIAYPFPSRADTAGRAVRRRLLVASGVCGPDPACRLVARPRTAAPGQRRRLLGHPPGVGERPAQQHLDVSVDAAELVVGPADQRVVD